MGCPILRFLPEIGVIAVRMKSRGASAALVGVAEEMCRQCREKTPGGLCPLGESFAEATHRSLSAITQVVLEEGGESREREWQSLRGVPPEGWSDEAIYEVGRSPAISKL